MKKLITVLAVLGMVFALAPVAQAAIALPDPGVVGPYRVIFVTKTRPTGVAADMASLNAWVTSLAVASTLDAAAGSPGWYVVGATTTVDVFTNTGLAASGGVPVYLVNGLTPSADGVSGSAGVFAADNAALWALGGTYLNINETGEKGSFGTAIQTGLTADPLTAIGKELDSSVPRQGGNDAGYNPWYGATDNWTGPLGSTSLFAISGVIGGEPLPPPGTVIVIR